MATDISTVKSTIVTDGVTASTKGAAQSNGAGIDFAEIIRNSGARLGSGLNVLSDRAGIIGLGARSDDAPAASDPSHDRITDNHDNGDSRADTNDHSDRPSDHDVSSRPDHSNDYGENHSQNNAPDTAEAAYDGQDNSQSVENHGENANQDDRSGESSNDNGASSPDSDNTEAANAADGDEGQQAATKGDGENTAGDASKGEAAHKGNATSNATNNLNSLLANAQGAALSGQASGQAQKNNDANPGKTNAVEGLNTAIANVGKQVEGAAANTGQSTTNSGNAQAQTQTHNLASNQGPAQAQNSAIAGTQGPGEEQAKDTTKAANQAAQLSKLVGNGNKVDVAVTVTDEKATLVSKPGASLVSNAVLAADSNTPSLRNQQTQANNNAGGQAQAQQVTGQATGAAGQVQQAVQQAAGGQAQSANAAAIDAKGAVQGTLHAGGAQPTLSGSGETPVATAPTGPTAAQQAQQSTSTQAAHANRFTTANPALTDQVSVQISKAINAGNDKISIQLKPAEMGRVDVQMEVGQDGRVIAVVSADNKGTLDLLQKDAKELQQALQQAGLQVDNDSLSFNLREQGDGQDMAGRSQSGRGQGSEGGLEDALSLEQELAGLDRDIVTDSRIDVRA